MVINLYKITNNYNISNSDENSLISNNKFFVSNEKNYKMI